MINNFMILGDSYSTHKDAIPENYAYYYCTEGRGEDPRETKMLPKETWWGRFVENGATLILNNSYSGSTVGYTGYRGDCSTTTSFIFRYLTLRDKGFFTENKIDTLFVFGGTNDSWANAPLGCEMYSDWKKEDLYSAKPAICYLMSKMKEDLPDTRIVFIANCDIKSEIIECIKNAAERIGVECVELTGVDKNNGHPTILGMSQIYEQVVKKLSEK